MSSHQPPSSQSTKPKSGREKESRPCWSHPLLQDSRRTHANKVLPNSFNPLILARTITPWREKHKHTHARTRGRHPRSIGVEISHRLSCHFYFLVGISPGAPESSLFVALGLLSSGPILGTPTEAILPRVFRGPCCLPLFMVPNCSLPMPLYLRCYSSPRWISHTHTGHKKTTP